MEIEKYRKLIQSIMEKHSSCDGEDPEVETQIAFDRDRYIHTAITAESLEGKLIRVVRPAVSP